MKMKLVPEFNQWEITLIQKYRTKIIQGDTPYWDEADPSEKAQLYIECWGHAKTPASIIDLGYYLYKSESTELLIKTVEEEIKRIKAKAEVTE